MRKVRKDVKYERDLTHDCWLCKKEERGHKPWNVRGLYSYEWLSLTASKEMGTMVLQFHETEFCQQSK